MLTIRGSSSVNKKVSDGTLGNEIVQSTALGGFMRRVKKIAGNNRPLYDIHHQRLIDAFMAGDHVAVDVAHAELRKLLREDHIPDASLRNSVSATAIKYYRIKRREKKNGNDHDDKQANMARR